MDEISANIKTLGFVEVILQVLLKKINEQRK